MTKKEIITRITEILTSQKKEVCISRLQNKLRNTRWGMHAYTLCAMEDCVEGWLLYLRPWAGANMCWRARLERLNKSELTYVLEQCEK